ncbi:EAL domain-containing protein [Undibacterium sp.]|jgi:diguanylate cyclase (GGDEF)-like protein|uniref:EAL domain-containing protein n=1 Tax=Undibacterium sp. TaxID=1914977 RepID=UPI002D1AA4A0|nr:EAL domain-containing protein [Undibacterium sp.]HTD06261.1 EAL domain-containing protein [Undibacterium sp.]
MANESGCNDKIDVDTLLKAIDRNEDAISKRLHHLEFEQADIDILASLGDKLHTYRQYFDELLYAHISASPQLVALVQSANTERLKIVQETYSSTMIEIPNKQDHIRDRINAGIILQDLGLEPEWYLGIYRKYLQALLPILWEASESQFPRFNAYINTLTKIIFFDIGVALDSYFIASQKAVDHNRKIEALTYHQTHDELTGLPNRGLLTDRVRQAFLLADRKGNNVALVHLGLDHFKLINDGVGYSTGDHILKNIGERLHKCVREGDTVSYHGADEFVIVLKDIDESGHVGLICEKILHLISKPFFINGKNFHITCSMGIALYPQDGKDAGGLSNYADIALTRAKELGRNNFQFFSLDMNEKMLEKITIASDLHTAIANNQLLVYYQPKADLQTGKMAGLEALVRWQHPVLGTLSSARFIPIAEESSLIDRIGDWVLGQVCHDIREWMDEGLDVPNIAINVSARQFLDPLFSGKLVGTLSSQGIATKMISLEITESILMNNNIAIEAVLKNFKALGITLALDDFGTGYSALSYLKHFPFDYVKIDRSFVKDIDTNTGDAAISNAIISMAHSLGLRVIAEGVETDAQCEFLCDQMCDEIQGYFFSKPLPAAEMRRLLGNSHHLPEHLLRMERPPRTLLLVDDEPNILASLKRLLRREGYQILLANSGQEGLEILEKNRVDVIISDQRMPNMTGVEFLRTAKISHPDTVRIVLSGYTELQSITDAINEGAIYKFLTKPWEDDQLRSNIQEAFHYKEMSDENRRLSFQIQTTNQELAKANRQLADILDQKQQQIKRDEISLEIVREALQHIPLALIGIDDDNIIAFINSAAELLLLAASPALGADIDDFLPEFSQRIMKTAEGEIFHVELARQSFQVSWRTMGARSRSRGKLVTFKQGADHE